MKFDHIGIVTATLSQGRAALEALLSIQRWTEEFPDTVNCVYVQFGIDSSGICYEVISPLGEKSPIAKVLSGGQNVLNHVAYLVPDLAAAHERLRAAGALPTSAANPAIAFGGRRIQFFVTRLRFIIELIEAPDHEHEYLVGSAASVGPELRI